MSVDFWSSAFSRQGKRGRTVIVKPFLGVALLLVLAGWALCGQAAAGQLQGRASKSTTDVNFSYPHSQTPGIGNKSLDSGKKGKRNNQKFPKSYVDCPRSHPG